MRRRQLFRLLPPLLALPLLALPSEGRAQGGAAALSAADRAALGRVEAYLNGLRSLRARFLQIAQNGAAAEGEAFILRPGRMRFDYDPPEPMLLIASGGQFLLYDRQMKSPSTIPVASTPLSVLLQENVRLSGEVTVTRVERGGGFLRITLHRTTSPAEGRLTLVFQEDPVELRQWVVVDAQARETRVTLSAIQTGMRLDTRLFDFNDPRFFEQEQR
jgi:outer membrane lipoprotein-sorting protein